MQLYAIGLAGSETELAGIVGAEFFRPHKFFTNIDAPGAAMITGIFLGDDPENQILGEIDAWNFSVTYVEQARAEFLRALGLAGKTDDEIQDYLDDNDLELPDVLRLVLRTLRKGERIRITGKFPPRFAISFLGHVP